MFYTKLGQVVAGLSVGLGLFGFVIGVSLAVGAEPGPAPVLGTKTSGQWIDRGIYMAVFGVIVGVLTDISRSVQK